jgi:exopolyphosphatase/guanosine-5'-triphosphate,3'-diphosphate pyrophosphatase
VSQLALNLYEQLTGTNAQATQCLAWAAQLHEIGISVAYSGYHRHSAYIVNNADMPGFTREEQHRIAQLLLAHRRSL